MSKHHAKYTNAETRMISAYKASFDGFALCALCGKPIRFDVDRWHTDGFSADHILSLDDGGTNSIDNLQPAHRGCNSSRGASEGNAKRAGRIAVAALELDGVPIKRSRNWSARPTAPIPTLSHMCTGMGCDFCTAREKTVPVVEPDPVQHNSNDYFTY